MSESQYVVYSLYFIAGLIAGVALCYVTITKFLKGHRLQDELLKSRRDLANAQRSIDEFLKTSSDLFSQLDNSYHRYADFMHSASEKMGTVGNELFISIEDLQADDEKVEETQNKKPENTVSEEVVTEKILDDSENENKEVVASKEEDKDVKEKDSNKPSE